VDPWPIWHLRFVFIYGIIIYTFKNINNQGLDYAPFREKYDVYSFGMVLWEILAQRKPFYRIRQPYILSLFDIPVMLSGYHPPLADVPENQPSGDIRSLIADCWDHDPQNRPNIETVGTRINSYMRYTFIFRFKHIFINIQIV